MKKFYLFLVGILPLSINSIEAYTEQEIQVVFKKNEKIKKIDQKLNSIYRILKNFSTPEEKKQLKVEQREWINQRNKFTSEKELYKTYKTRYTNLKERILIKEKPIMEQIITGSQTIDKEKASDLLKNCPTLACRAYKIYFDTEGMKNKEKQIKKRKQDIKTLCSIIDPSQKHTSIHEPFENNVLFEILSFVDSVLPSDREAPYILKVPLWLVLEHPEIMDYDTETYYRPYGVEVISDQSVDKLPSFESFDQKLQTLFVGRWMQGTSYRPFFSSQHKMQDFLSFSPDKLKIIPHDHQNHGVTLNNLALEKWSFLGPWNYQKYQDFKKAFETLAQELKKYYDSQEFLKKYAPQATDYLNRYVYFNFDNKPPVTSEKAYEVLHKPNQKIEDLKKDLQNLSPQDWNAALSYAILNNYNLEAISWIIQSGADINAIVDDEPILIKASNRPDILEFLISKGAQVDGKTEFGKTSLFYAVQFNNLESVKVLLEKGANINAVLLKKDHPDYDEYKYYDLATVLGFTPLAYSIRYGSQEMTKLLLEKGATLKEVSEQTLKNWINDNQRFESQMVIIKEHINRK